MKTENYDILVVGAGPAGSSAAIRASGMGLRVLMVERRKDIGIPVRCAEYIPAPLLGELNLGRGFVVQSVKGMKTFLPGGEIHETRAPGFMIRRDLLDQALAGAAEKTGAKIRVSTKALSPDRGGVLLRSENGVPSKVTAKVIIGADGPLSTVGRWIESRNENPIPAIQCRFSLVHPLSHTEVYFDREIYGGYGWLFPKGREANVGLGMRKRTDGDLSIRVTFSRFISRLTETGKIEGDPYQWTAGWIPVRPLDVTARDNILLAGDAAGHTHPISGAGIHNAIVCGEMAGEAAARAIKRDDMTLLSEYEREWRDFLGDTLNRGFERRQILEKEWDRLHEILPQCWIAFRAYYDKL